MTDMISTITATKITGNQRLGTLPRYFGAQCAHIEGVIFDFAGAVIPSYKGAYWDFYALSNGGFFMAPDLGKPDARVKVTGPAGGNMYDGEMTQEAAGIVCCLHAYSHASFAARDGSDYQHKLAEAFHALRDFAAEHPEADEIFAAID